jgi:TonB family protein
MPSTAHRRSEQGSLAPLSTAIWFAVLIASSTAIAQVATPLTRPVATGSTDVPYPPNATGDAVVLVELVVETDGTVSSAEVVEGVEPFAEQARSAVMIWRFIPARRGEAAVAARIRARVEFHQENRLAGSAPVEPASGTAAAPGAPARAPTPAVGVPPPAGQMPTRSASQSPPPAPVSAPKVPEAPLDVTVRGTRHEIGQTTLSTADIREMPGAFGDPFRAIEALPGVIPLVSGLPYFYIRGAPPNDTGYFIDGVRVPFLFHVGIGEGVIHPALVDRVDLYPGAPPAAYGGYAGAIVAGETRDPASKPHGEANLRLFDAGALVETPLDDGRGSALVAGRYGYPGPILGLFTQSVKLSYWDYQARVTWRLTGSDSIGIFAFGSHDYLGTVPQRNGGGGPSGAPQTAQSNQVVEQLGSDFHRVDLRYDRLLEGGHLRLAATLGYDSQGGGGESDGAPPATIADLSTGLRLKIDKRISGTVRFRGGADARFDRYTFEQGGAVPDQGGAITPPVPSTADPPPTNLTAGAHVDVVWRVAPRVEIVPGARFDVFESTRPSGPPGVQRRTMSPAVDPRLSARISVTPIVALLSTVGISHQYPSLRVGPLPGLLLSVPGFPFGDTQLQRAVQASLGVEVSLPADIVLTATGFLSLWSGLTDLTANCIQIMPPTTPAQSDPNAPPPIVPYTCPDEQPVNGHAYGLEVLVRRPLSKRLTGWLSYTLSRSERETHFVTLTGGDAAATVPSEFDRTHILNAILAYDLGRRWRAGTRFVYYTGAPYSDLSGNVPVPPYNNHRGPPFFRMDVRLEKRWSLGKDRSLAFVLEGLNVTLSREVTTLGMSCEGTMTPQGGTTQCRPSHFGPLTIPSVGVEAVF